MKINKGKFPFFRSALLFRQPKGLLLRFGGGWEETASSLPRKLLLQIFITSLMSCVARQTNRKKMGEDLLFHNLPAVNHVWSVCYMLRRRLGATKLVFVQSYRGNCRMEWFRNGYRIFTRSKTC